VGLRVARGVLRVETVPLAVWLLEGVGVFVRDTPDWVEDGLEVREEDEVEELEGRGVTEREEDREIVEVGEWETEGV
jgi:hypothetical protein